MRSIVVPLSLTLSLLAGCGVKDPPAEQDASEAEPQVAEAPMLPPIGARVLVREDRGLAIEPKRDAARVSGVGHELRVAEVIAHVGDFVELRTVADEPSEVCTAGGFDPSFELRFFALPDELERVLGKPKRVEFEDGTRLELAAGVPIIGQGSGATLQVGAAEFLVPLADDEIATWFQPAPIEAETGQIRWRSGLPLHYGEQRIIDTADPPFAVAVAEQAIEGGTLLSFASACGRFTLRAEGEIDEADSGLYAMKRPKDAVPQLAQKFDPEMAARNAGILGVMQGEGGHFLASPYGAAFAVGDDDEIWGACEPSVKWTAPAKAELRWQQTGTVAGVVVRETVLPRPASEIDGKVCFVVTGLDVCIASAQLQRDEQQCEYQGLGLIGEGSGQGFGGRGKSVPQVRLVKPEVSEGLDAEIVRRIVRAHSNEIRSCYNAGLTNNPKLAGRITIAFEIGGNGKVRSSAVQQTTLDPADDNVDKCLVKAVKRWLFPKPKGAVTVSVVYPFDLKPG